MTKDLEHLISEGRGKLLPVSRELVLDCIVTKTTEITRIARVSLPDEMHVTSIFYDDRAGCFMFVIYSEAFDPVPLGREVPLFHDYEMVSLKVVESGGIEQNTVKKTEPPIAKTMRCPDCGGDLLKSRAGEFGKCTICRALFYLDPGVDTPIEEPSIHERFAPITISKGTLVLLQRIAHGRTMNMVIKELYDAYTEKKAEMRGPLRD